MEEIDFTENTIEAFEGNALEIKKALDSELIYRKTDKFIVDYTKIIVESPELFEIFINNPSEFMALLKSELKDRFGKTFPIYFKNFEEEEQISNLRVEHLGKIVKVAGMLSNATGVLALVKFRNFTCVNCGTIIRVVDSKKVIRCSCGNNKNFKLIHTQYQNMQEIVLEENQDEIGDRSPRRTRVRLVDELCDKELSGIVKDGNKIEVIGIVEEIPLKKDNKTNDEIYQFRIFALQIRSLENEFDETITEDDIAEIDEISIDNPLDRLAKSLAPSIIGNEDIKKTLVLSMFSGVPISDRYGKKEKYRIHGLLIGDAGTSKTVMLTEACRRHYKSRYVSSEGNAVSKVGLCVHPDSRIWENGKITDIKSFCEKYFNGIDVYEETEIKLPKEQYQFNNTNKIKSVWKIPSPDELVKITTKNGKEIKLTKNTKLMTDNGWVKSSELKSGDYLKILNENSYSGVDEVWIGNLLFDLPVKINKGKEQIMDNLFKEIKKKQINIREMCKETGIRENKIYHEWGKGSTSIKLNELRIICDYMGIEIKSILPKSITCTLRNGNCFKVPLYLTGELSYLLGIIFGDGSVSINNKSHTGSIRFTTMDKDSEFIKISRELFGVNPKPIKNKRLTKATDYRFNSYILSKLLEKLGIKDKKYIDNRIIKSKPLIKSFLTGLFDTDGYVYMEEDSIVIGLSQSNKNLIKDVISILSRFNIRAYFREKNTENRTNYLLDGRKIITMKKLCELEIKDIKSVKNYIDNIGFRLNRKKETLLNFNDKIASKVKPNYVKIVGVEIIKSDVPYVYDLTVEDHHSFYCNDFIVHNTASVEKDELLGTWALKAGYLPRTNNGLVGIDELDKADKDIQKSLHTPLESGIVTVSKAGINSTLNADVTVICSANPKNGRFEDSKSLVEQINMEETLLSRFDWIWVMRDELDEGKDMKIANSIWDNDYLDNIVDVSLFKKYIKYAQKFKPKTTIEARELINKFYVDVRKQARRSDGLVGMPIVPRHLKGLKRMAEANAKIRLSHEVTTEDAKIAIDLFKKSLIKLGLDEEVGIIDMARLGTGKTATRLIKMQKIKDLLRDLGRDNSQVPQEAIMLEATKLNMDLVEVEKTLQDLYKAGEIYSPRRGIWALA